MSCCNKVGQIVVGHINLAKSKVSLLSPELRQLSLERLTICGGCKHNTGNRCELCGCVLSAKSKVPDAVCPINLW